MNQNQVFSNYRSLPLVLLSGYEISADGRCNTLVPMYI